MATKLLTETYAEAMDGMLACYDRLIIDRQPISVFLCPGDERLSAFTADSHL